MIIRTNTPGVLDTVFKVLSDNNVRCTKINNNQADVQDIAETDLRLMIQNSLDSMRFDFVNNFVRVDGNAVWSHRIIVKEIDIIKMKDSTTNISKYFYSFMHNNFTGVCSNLRGWSDTYPNWHAVSILLNDAYCPVWKSDVLHIIKK